MVIEKILMNCILYIAWLCRNTEFRSKALVLFVQIELLSRSREFSDIQLRMNEKRSLNTLNRDKNRITIRSETFTGSTVACTIS